VLPTYARLVLDLGQVQFIDSSGCGAILSCLKALTGHGGDLKLCRITPTVRNVFKLIRLDKICDLFDTRDAAVRAFGPPAAK
jgi:anti-sigma B factor antagonist